jgi:hypothetical protein
MVIVLQMAELKIRLTRAEHTDPVVIPVWSGLHRRLTTDVGHPKLKEHLASVTTLMRASENWNGFKNLIDRALPVHIPMPLFDGLKDDYGEKQLEKEKVTTAESGD